MWHTKLKTQIPMGPMAGPDFHSSAMSMGHYSKKAIEGRPRAYSAPDTAILGVRIPPGQSNGGGMVSSFTRQSPNSPVSPVETVDSTRLLPIGDCGEGSPHPALRSIHNGLPTTAEQKRVARDLNGTGSHQGYMKVYGRGGGGGVGGGVRRVPGGAGMGGVLGTRRNTRQRQFSVQSRRENFEMKCCRINVLLVIMQMSLGAVVTGLAFYMQTLSPSLAVRECPYWAGIPLLLAGVVGIYFCATDFAAYAGNLKAFIIKCICFTLSAASVFLCMIGSVFPGIHGSRISSYVGDCTLKAGRHCLCTLSNNPQAKVYEYRDVYTCDLVRTSVKDYLILECALNAIASGVCFWFITLLWKARYQDFYSGLRFQPSYAGNQQSLG